MVDETRKVIRVEVESQRAQAQLDALRKSLEDMGIDMATVNRRFDALEKNLNAIGKSANGAKDTARATSEISKSADGAANSAKRLSDSQNALITQRYALYDVANAYLAIGAAIAGAATYAVVTAARFEAAFTNVSRTLSTDVSTEGVNRIREALVGLSQQIPLTFQEISQIATIGNQMGIQAENIEGFTSTVARFASVSGMSIDAVTQAFGTFAAQTGLSAAQFENLGSSIAKVSIDSNATEEQIVSLMKEITAGARQAGLGADAIVGLSGTLASLGVAPERARGSLTTYFSTLNRAVANGGEDLEAFATIVGETSESLSEMVQAGQGGQVLEQFLEGLSGKNGVAATQALDQLGLAQLRVSDTFIRLSQNLDNYGRDQANANEAFMSGAELQRQYAQTVDDLASQWQIFINSLNAMIDAVTGGAIPGLAALFQQVNKVVQGFTEWLGDNKWAGSILRIVAIFGTLTGALFLVRGAFAAARAMTLAFAIMNAQAASAGVAAAGTYRGLAASLFGVGTGATAASRGLRILRATLITTGIGALAVAAGFLLENLMPIPDAMEDASISTIDYGDAVSGLEEATSGAVPGTEDLGKALEGTGNAASEVAEKVRTLVDYVNDLSGVFRRSSDIRFGEETAMDVITDKWLELNEQAREYNTTIRSLTADRSLKQYWLGIAEAYDDQLRASELREEIAQIDDKLATANQGADKSLTGNTRAAIRNRNTVKDLLGDYEDYILAMAGAGASQEEIQKAIAELNKDFLLQGKGLGFSEEELKKYLLRFEDLEKIINAVPRDINVDFNTDPALQALNEFFAKANEMANAAGKSAGGNFADGVGSGLGGGGGGGGIPWDNAFPKKVPGRGVGRIKDWSRDAIRLIADAFKTGDWSKVQAALGVGIIKTFGDITRELGNFWRDFGNIWTTGTQLVGREFNNFWSDIDRELRNFYRDAGRELGNFWRDFGNNWNTGMQIVGREWNNFWRDIGQGVGNIWADISREWGNFWRDFSNGWGIMWKTINTVATVWWEAITSGFRNFFGGLFGLSEQGGKNVAGGLTKGLKGGLGDGTKPGKDWVAGIGRGANGGAGGVGTNVGVAMSSSLRARLDRDRGAAGTWATSMTSYAKSKGASLGSSLGAQIIVSTRDRIVSNTTPITQWSRNLNNAAATAGRAAGGAMAGGLNAGLTASDPIFQWERKQVGDAPTRGRSIGNALGRNLGSNVLYGINQIDPIFQWEKKQVRDAAARGRSIGGALGRAIGAEIDRVMSSPSAGGRLNASANISNPYAASKAAPRLIGAGGSAASGSGSVPVELGPASLEYLANALRVSLYVDGRQLATASSSGDKSLAWAGSN